MHRWLSIRTSVSKPLQKYHQTFHSTLTKSNIKWFTSKSVPWFDLAAFSSFCKTWVETANSDILNKRSNNKILIIWTTIQKRLLKKPSHWMKICSAVSIWITISKCNRKYSIIPLELKSGYIKISSKRIEMEIVVLKTPNSISLETIIDIIFFKLFFLI